MPHVTIHIPNTNLLVEATLALLVAANFESLAPLDGMHAHRLAGVALKAKHDLLRGFRFFVEHGLCLPTKTGLFAVVTTLA